ncbi:MAG: helix-turn-helix transcriptional regulator [Candidatus Sericytochromatia bacterium]|nr:helix-turn-helix transcriptional regulator [Candidatus Sericytochromatia bacterium]
MTTLQRTRKNKKRPLHSTGRMIKQLRKASGYTQEEIKNILGFQATSAISKIESRDFIPDLMRLQKLLTLLNPSTEQRRQILEYYGYQENELPERYEFISGLKKKAEKGDILSALHTLFYLFVYDRDYTGVTEAVQGLYQKSFYIPQAVRNCSRELEMILREIFSCRRMMAQGMLSRQHLTLEEATQRAKVANQLLDLVFERFGKKLSEDGRLFLSLLRLHIAFCNENAHFCNLELRARLNRGSLADMVVDKQSHYSLPQSHDVVAQLEKDFPDYNLQDIRQMSLFIEREALYLMMSQCQFSDQQMLQDSLKSLGQSYDISTPLAVEWIKAIKTHKAEPVFTKIYDAVYKANKAQAKIWEPTLERFRQTLKAHQQVTNWDVSTAQTAVVSAFLQYPVMLARLGHYAWSQDVMNLLYLQLTVAETHYRWNSNMGICLGLEYIGTTQLSTKKLSEAKFKQAEQSLLGMLKMLQQVVLDLKQTKSLNSSRLLRYSFLEEPAYYLVLLHASKHYQFRELPEVKVALAQMNEQIKLLG